jgi:hypothetical protein
MYNIMSKLSFIVCLSSRLVLSTKLYLSVSLQTLTPLSHVFWPTSPCTWSNANQSSYQVWCIFNTILQTTYDFEIFWENRHKLWYGYRSRQMGKVSAGWMSLIVQHEYR